MNASTAGNHLAIVSITSSSRKAGKSALASYLVSELGAEFGLKVSSGGHAPSGSITSDTRIIETPDTDTGKMIAAGARRVLWVHADPTEMDDALRRAVSMFGGEGLLVAEGNGASLYLDPDYTVFLMGVPLADFKPSAFPSLERSDLVLVDRSGVLGEISKSALEKDLFRLAPGPSIIFYDDNTGMKTAQAETARLIRAALNI